MQDENKRVSRGVKKCVYLDTEWNGSLASEIARSLSKQNDTVAVSKIFMTFTAPLWFSHLAI